ncbi:alpha/beta fold hydrolase [Metabacillus bambusae]|uniref:Alpha/beta hydrolase n=1 Tax=Metabacillus bambusae TaxID=2795218 RepID=A0ABS3N9M1_9BACI|nr:alpha/beta hydrolase [Metabacillus bambusae]MBO1514994.1 alpha/beta hydrolase [Metabacillus bambusae]
MQYNSPTLINTGEKDIFFPANRLNKVAREIISNLIDVKTIDMGHFPSEEHLIEINNEIKGFLNTHY